MSLRVVIVGPGALGQALGRTLARHGAEVGYLGREGPWGVGFPAEPDVALVAVKAYDTEAAMAAAAPFIGPAPVVSLQNGLGNVPKIATRIDPSRVFGGSTTHAARRTAGGELQHVALGETRIAPFQARGLALAEEVADRFTAHGIATYVERDLDRLVWRKLIASCGINAVTALYGLTNGDVLDHREALELAIEASSEALEVARDTGVDVNDIDPASLVRGILESTAANRASMLQDVEAGRRTEAREINGAVSWICRERLGRETPVNDKLTTLLREHARSA